MRRILTAPSTANLLPLFAVIIGGCGAAPTAEPEMAPPPSTIVIINPPAEIAVPSSPELARSAFGQRARLARGLEGRIYAIAPGTKSIPDFATLTPMGTLYTTGLDVSPRRFDRGFPGVTDRNEWFGIDYTGRFSVDVPGEYRFRLTADDGAKLFIDGALVVDDDGIHPPKAAEGAITLAAGSHALHVPYFQGPRFDIALMLDVAAPGEAFQTLRTDRSLGSSPALP